MERHAVEPQVAEDRAHRKVERMGDDQRRPAALAAPANKVEKTLAGTGVLEHEGQELVAGRFNAGKGGSEDADSLSLRAQLETTGDAACEALQQRLGDAVCEHDVVEVKAEDGGHLSRIDVAGWASTTLRQVERDRARYLVSARGRAHLASLPPGCEGFDPVQLSTLLRRSFAPGEAAALGEQVVLHARATARFGGEAGWLFTAEGLEMMTHPLVAARRAARLARLGLPVADLTCGIGGDLGACADAGLRTIGVERDPVTALLAASNVPGASVVQGDALRPPLDLAGVAAIIDPSRRGGLARTFDPMAFAPPWDLAVSQVASARAGVLKAPPGIDRRYLPPGAEVEYVQLGRSMREATVWVGAETSPGLRRAVLLPGNATLDSASPEAPTGTAPAGPFVFDPESCVTLAGLVRQLASRLGARLLDERVGYLTGPVAVFDPLCATFETLDVIPFSISRLKERLRNRRWAPAEIRRRAFPIEPDELRRLLGRIEGDAVTLLCTTLNGQKTVIVGRRLVQR